MFEGMNRRGMFWSRECFGREMFWVRNILEPRMLLGRGMSLGKEYFGRGDPALTNFRLGKSFFKY